MVMAFIAPDRSQQSKSLWRKRRSELPFRNIVVAESQVFVSQGRKFDVQAVDHREK